jgi:hypothetical protein
MCIEGQRFPLVGRLPLFTELPNFAEKRSSRKLGFWCTGFSETHVVECIGPPCETYFARPMLLLHWAHA